METALTATIYIFAVLTGLTVGSFLNVLAYRIPNHISFAKGRSFCPSCKHMIRWYDNIPLLSFLILRGKCRDCGAKISWRYPIIEALGGASAALSLMFCGFRWQTVVTFAAACILIAVSAIDFDTQEIPNGLVIALIVPAVAAVWTEPEIDIWSRVIGIFAVSAPMLIMALVIKGAFGGGDIKLIAVAGFLLGWQRLLVAAFIALVAGGIYGVCLLAGKKARRDSHFAFGPFLSAGIAAAMWWGTPLIGMYLGLWGL